MHVTVRDMPPTVPPVRRADGPHLVFFGVDSRRELRRRAAAAAPGVRFVPRRAWTEDPGTPRRPLLGGGPPVGLWYWRGTADDFVAQASRVLLRFIHPLIARRLPFCLGFPFGPEVLEPTSLTICTEATLDLEDIGRLLRGAGPPLPAAASCRPTPRRRPAAGPDAARLDAAQRAAVEHRRGPARVLAPAGSGKTKTLVSRVVELVDRGADPSGILLLAFNRKAAEQLEERLAALGIATTRRLVAVAEARSGRSRRPGRAASHDRPEGVHCATFNAFGYRYQRQVLGTRISLDHDGRALRGLMARSLETAGVSLAELRPRRGSDPLGAFMRALTRVRAALEPPDHVDVTIESLTATPLVTVPFAPVHGQYLRAQTVTGLQSFDDQIYLALLDMLADPSHRAFIQRRFDHLLVDEFQDLNGAQLALVDLLSRPHRRLFVVGDDDQLIYGWRQADPRGILEFHRRMPPEPWSATYRLGTNYRCSRAVVETGARLVGHNRVREAKDIRPRADAEDGAVRFVGAPAWSDRAAALCAFLTDEKARLSCGWRDLAVLCRYRAQQLLVALALDEAGIPRTPALGCRLFTHRAARLLRTAIQLARSPDDVAAVDLADLLDRLVRGVGGAAIESLRTAPDPWGRLRELGAAESAAGHRPLSDLVERVETVRRAAAPASAEDLVWTVAEAFGLDALWAAEADAAAADSGGGPDGGPLEVVDSLLLLAQTHPDPEVYVHTWDRLGAAEAAHAGADALADDASDADLVVIGTIHAAKGREYHSVVIPDYDCDVSRCTAAEVEEERRVVYVGVTRARDAALFTVDTSTGFVHPFLRELVEPPDPGEHETLSAWLAEESDPGLRRRLTDRLGEIEVLFPELVPPTPPGP